MIAWLWLACAASPPDVPPELTLALSGYHHAPPLEGLSERFPDLPTHLRTLVADPEVSPLVQSRAWVLLAQTPGAGPMARDAVGDASLRPALRNKILRSLAEGHPTRAAEAVAEVWCDDARIVAKNARTVAEALGRAGVVVTPPDCSAP